MLLERSNRCDDNKKEVEKEEKVSVVVLHGKKQKIRKKNTYNLPVKKLF